MANPQSEDGHIDIAHPIAEALAKINLSPHESRFLWALLRKTYGWHQKTDRISLGQFSKITGIPRSNIPRIIKRLAKRSLITVSRINRITEYGFQKNFELWDDGAITQDAINRDVINRDVIPTDNRVVSVQMTKMVSALIPTKETKETIQKKLYKRNYTKETIKETIQKKEYGEFKNVLLTDGEYQKLIERFGEQQAKDLIEKLSAYLASKGKRYKSHYATILNWQRRDKEIGKAHHSRALPKTYTPTPHYPDL